MARTCPCCGEQAPVPNHDVWYWEGPVQGGRWVIVWYHRWCWFRHLQAVSGGGWGDGLIIIIIMVIIIVVIPSLSLLSSSSSRPSSSRPCWHCHHRNKTKLKKTNQIWKQIKNQITMKKTNRTGKNESTTGWTCNFPQKNEHNWKIKTKKTPVIKGLITLSGLSVIRPW